jgi:hypothetical protein
MASKQPCDKHFSNPYVETRLCSCNPASFCCNKYLVFAIVTGFMLVCYERSKNGGGSRQYSMAVQCYWDQHDPHIFIFDLRADWTWEEFHAAADTAMETVKNVSEPVYVISLSSGTFPPANSIISHFQRIIQQLPPNLALIVVVTDSFLVETINQIFFKVSPLGRRIGRLAKTKDAARQVILNYHAKHHPSA